jgi:hypothetical protein
VRLYQTLALFQRWTVLFTFEALYARLLVDFPIEAAEETEGAEFNLQQNQKLASSEPGSVSSTSTTEVSVSEGIVSTVRALRFRPWRRFRERPRRRSSSSESSESLTQFRPGCTFKSYQLPSSSSLSKPVKAWGGDRFLLPLTLALRDPPPLYIDLRELLDTHSLFTSYPLCPSPV